jgi:type II secretory pathway pseudopilin PulG
MIWKWNKKTVRGFTYLWVLMLVAFMGLGLSAAAVIDSTLTRRSQEQELLAAGHQFRDAIARYYAIQTIGGQHEYPNSLDDLLLDNRLPGLRRHLRKVFVDPMTQKPDWGVVRVGGRIVGVHSLSESQPIKQDFFAAEDVAFRGKAKYSDWVFTHLK